MMATTYTAGDIQVLRGLEPVRLRPGMFIGNTSTTGLHHLVTEALDNAVDEALNGYCDHIHITIGADNTITVSDNGRGIPVETHRQSRKNTLETIMTTLHSGGKFSTKSYQISGGLRSLAFIVDDPDAPDPKAPKMTWVHWVLYDLPSTAAGLAEGVASRDLPAGTREGVNDRKRTGYGGPCPPRGRHRYFHKLYALDTALGDLGKITKSRLEAAMQGHVLAQAELVGTYERDK